MVLHRPHLEDVVVHVDLELELLAEEPLHLHDVEEDRAVLHRADEDRDAVAVRRCEERRALHAERFLDLGDVLPEQVVQLGRRHLLLELGLAEDGAEEAIGLEERLLPEAEVVDPDDAREAVLKVARVRVDLADGVADDAVGVVVEVRAGRRDAVDEPALDERDEARLVEPCRRHRAAEGEEGASCPRATLRCISSNAVRSCRPT